MPKSKRWKRRKELKLQQTEDRISNLPISLIGYILSFLETKDAVRTSILSSQWKYMWTTISNLDIHYCGDRQLFYGLPSDRNGDELDTSFINFVDRVLFLLQTWRVNKFRLCCLWICDISHGNAWISEALSRNVRELDICFPFRWSVLLPTDLFTCKTLAVLKLGTEFVVNVPGSICLQSLKILHLNFFKFGDDESCNRLFSGCPVLEDASLQYLEWKNINGLKISGAALKTLVIEGSMGLEFRLNGIELDTPSLQSLEYSGDVPEVHTMKKFHSLGRARVDFRSNFRYLPEENNFICRNLTIGFFQRISNVHTLYISQYSIEVIEWICYQLPVLPNLTCLNICVNSVGWTLLPALLAISPQLTTLVFEEGFLESGYDTCTWSPPDRVPTCLVDHLEVIDIRAFRGLKDELEIVEYFLKNAKVLKTLNIHSEIPRRKEFKVTKTLLDMPRGSTSCKVVVC